MKIEAFFNKIVSESRTLLPHDDIWYRGHSETNYELVPTIYRAQDINEIGLFYEYKANVAAINNSNKEDWALLLDMQHYGLPTRMLDWTTSLGTALFFALNGNSPSPCIWLLDPYELSQQSTHNSIVYDTAQLNSHTANYNKNFDVSKILLRESQFTKPFSIQPPHSNRRIAAQRGRFTVHCKSQDSIEKQCPAAVKKIDIPVNLIEPLKLYLQLFGIDYYSQFPDHYGLSSFLKKQFGIS
ncbi:MAG: hypothetical protein ACJAZP_000702 [Psychromonas sp.]|jgi:hypothetical protein|uniref:FRG domain-containing protein n=1 Tax=Psychromonas sp. TaxID=1884585 RepID=UPI0039E6F6D8